MNRAYTLLLIFETGAAIVNAQPQTPGAPPPVPLFSEATIQSFTPADNPVTDAKAKLGDMNFDEKRLSADNTIACNTCHSPRNGFTTHTGTSRGVGDQLGKRNAPSILNAMFYKTMFWDGRAQLLKNRPRCPFSIPSRWARRIRKMSRSSYPPFPNLSTPFRRCLATR